MKRPVRDPVTGTYDIKEKYSKNYLFRSKFGTEQHIKLNMV